MLEIFDYPFLVRAFIACLLVGSLTSYLSAFVVQRRMSFLGSGLSHASFGGIALGLLLGLNPIAIAAPFTIVVALAITWVHKNTKVENDTAIGVFFAVTMALGILFISLHDRYGADAMTYLFGSILAVQEADLWAAGVLLLVCMALLKRWGEWAFASFDREFFKAEGHRVDFDDYLLSLLLSLVVIVSVKIMGVVLLAAFLVIPGATAQLISKRFVHLSILSLVFGVVSSAFGLWLSYQWNFPSGASIILAQSSVFVILAIMKKIFS